MGVDTPFVRDRMVNTLHFNIGSPAPDYQALANDLASIYASKFSTTMGIYVKLYPAGSTPPNPPLAEKTLNNGAVIGTNVPREVALCLSFRGAVNSPRTRGRVYIPAGLIGESVSLRPSLSQMERTLELATSFANLGGADVDWSVYSRRNSNAVSVQAAWIDNEWDTQRSRGLRADNRVTVSLSE